MTDDETVQAPETAQENSAPESVEEKKSDSDEQANA